MQDELNREIKSLTDQVKGWYDRTPWAQKARQRLTEDLDTMVAHLDAATADLQEKVRPFIDPPRQAPGQAAARPDQTAASTATPAGESAPMPSNRTDAADDRQATGGEGSSRLDASAS